MKSFKTAIFFPLLITCIVGLFYFAGCMFSDAVKHLTDRQLIVTTMFLALWAAIK